MKIRSLFMLVCLLPLFGCAAGGDLFKRWNDDPGELLELSYFGVQVACAAGFVNPKQCDLADVTYKKAIKLLEGGDIGGARREIKELQRMKRNPAAPDIEPAETSQLRYRPRGYMVFNAEETQ